MSQKPQYERPVIVRHQAGLMNKLSRTQTTRPMTHIEGVSIDELIQTYGSPLFVFSERTLINRYREIHDTYSRHLPRVRVAWSYKTNYLNAVCRVFHKEGAWAEVVSEFEYDKAVHLGVPPQRIHFNGPYKPEGALRKAFADGAIVHIDHFDEIALAEKVAESLGRKPGVAIRLNYGVEGTPPWSRFGFNIESGQAMDAVGRIIGGGKLDLIGLHSHLGTFIQNPEVYKNAVTKVAQFGNEIRDRFGVKLDFFDVGGGIASHNNLKGQYYPGAQTTPSIARYAEAVADGLKTLNVSPAELPTLVLENGRAMVDDAGFLISTVMANKRLPDGRRGVVVDAGVNVLFTSFWYNHEVVPAQPFRGIPEPTVFYGPLCMNIDIVRDSHLFPSVDVGERVVFKSVGAYNV
ncbi:diaminopimelate decarboxylase, partial [Myxococcota bacterium]|nr:diaminopimelate decarboxylase [Myxococcota bacterium]